MKWYVIKNIFNEIELIICVIYEWNFELNCFFYRER